MEARATSTAPAGLRARLATAWIAIALLLAYAAVLRPAPGAASLADALFLPGAVPPPLGVAVAAFALWVRRDALRALRSDPAPAAAVGFAALGLALFAWAARTGSVSVALASLGAHGLAAAAASRGLAGCRVVAVPVAILLLPSALPKPLEDELLWQLQRGTAWGAGLLLAALGREVERAGVILRGAEHTFHVIDGCSGLGGIVILTLVAFVVRDLFASAGRRMWIAVALAAPLGFAINVVRVAYVAASPDPEALAGFEGDHTPQGLAVLMAGTAALYAAGWAIARTAGPRAPAAAPAAPVAGSSGWALGAACAVAAVLVALAGALPRFPEARRAPEAIALDFPREKEGWRSEVAPPERVFHGKLFGGTHRRYRLPRRGGPDRVVDLLVGFEDASTADAFRLLSAKLAHPGPEWRILERRREPIFVLGRKATVALAARGEERALTYSWRPRDRGLLRESWRAWWSLEAGPFRRARPRAAVRLAAFAEHDGEMVLEWAKQHLDRFALDFRDELGAL